MKTMNLAAFAAMGICIGSPALAVDFSMFGDINVTASKTDRQFNLGSLDLSVEQNISDSSTVTSDFLFRYDQEERHYGVDVERLSISRDFAAHYEIFMGKFVTGLGLWAQTFNHGSLGQDTVTAPFFLESENRHVGIISSHLTGLGVSGKLGRFGFQAVVANPIGIHTGKMDEHGFEVQELDRGAPGKTFTQLLRVSLAPNWKTEFGLVMESRSIVELDADKVEPPATIPPTPLCANGLPADNSGVEFGKSLFTQNRAGFDFFYNGDKFYSYIEYYRISVEDNQNLQGSCIERLVTEVTGENPEGRYAASSGHYNADVYYAQMGYRFSSEWAATLRHESLTIADNDSTFFQVTHWLSQTRDVFGINYRFDASNALRFEASRTKLTEAEEGYEPESLYIVQWFFLLL